MPTKKIIKIIIVKIILALLLLIPSLSWGEPIYLECMHQEIEYYLVEIDN